ncbi:DUF6603 domain-containing protein [Mesorhizobium sp.]|uniref:DUF6603 domain-containing protein n=1 Tax=Mesorhizobium sp. TaxID=1871066 RepID=UPI000FE575A5|nr:DUF6603 domain-containing protein [Mesorhizobium sp.]RWC62377.1 MAG: hypothetical protein EOS56_07390 [Mesorhizobium sp.]
MSGVISTFFVELRRFFGPITVAVASPQNLAVFARRFGYGLAGPDMVAAAGQLRPMGHSVVQLGGTIKSAVANGLRAQDVVAIGDAALPLFQGIRTFHQAFNGAVPQGMTAQAFAQQLQSFPEELFDLLLTDYLTQRVPLALHGLSLLDVVGTEFIPETGAQRSRGLAYVATSYRWDRIGLLFDHPDEWAKQAYGWGVDFRSDVFIRRLANLFDYLGGVADLRDMTREQALVFMPDIIDAAVKPHVALAPIVRTHGVPAAQLTGMEAAVEFGLALFPVSGKTPATRKTDAGLAIGPYTEGQIAQTIPLAPTVDLKLSGAVGATGGIVFSFRPSGADHQIGVGAAAFNGEFGAEIVVKPGPGGNKIILIGDPGSTRIEIDSAAISVGGGVSNAGAEFFAAAGVKALHVVVDASKDGFLGFLLGGPIEVDAGDLLIGWRSGRGIYFEGGTGVQVTIPLDKQIGPFHLHEIGIGLDWKDAFKTSLSVTADAKLGPLFAYVEGLGLTATLVPNDHGALGKFDIVFGLKLPTGYAVALDAPPISGGGFLSVGDNEYRGALALKLATFGVSAFAVLNTRLPGGQKGFSFVASIFGDFVFPLGFGFFLTGLGGLIGINRTANTDALREVLYAGNLDTILFPNDPIANASTILDSMAAIFPPREGQYLFGPMAKIAFSQPPLIEGKLGIVLEIGSEVRLLILGAVGSKLPTRDAPLVSLEVAFFGEIDFGAGTISFDATLQNSYILLWGVSGDVAVRTGWAPRINHIISFGGLHPRYPKPANLPDLRRMSINFGTNNPRISLWAYQALTLNSLQFGAGADLYAKGPKILFVGRVAAEGHAYFHALIYFNPFAFDVQLGGSLSLLVDGDVVAGLGFDLRLTGPNNFRIDGKVWVTIFGIDVDFGVSHEWGDKRQLPPLVADPVAVLRDAIAAAPALEAIPAADLSDGVRFVRPGKDELVRPVSPVGGLRFSQKAMPLGMRIEKLGETQIAGSARSFDLAAYPQALPGDPAVATEAAEIEFVHGHFWNISEADRLREPAYERLKSGFEIAGGARLRIDTSKAITSEYGYELVMIGDERDILASELFAFTKIVAGDLSRWMTANHATFVSPLDAKSKPRPDSPSVKEAKFGFAEAGAASAASFAQFGTAAAAGLRNPVVADYMMGL